MFTGFKTTPFFLLMFVFGCFPGTPSTPPNIVLIYADDLGYGDLSSYGHPAIQTPNLDQMAAGGVRLTSFYAPASVCTPSRAGLLTGRYPVRSGMTRVIFPEFDWGLPLKEQTLPEYLQAAGYQNILIGKWHLGSKPPFTPLQHGFQHFFGLLHSNDMMRPWVETDVPLEFWRDHDVLDIPLVQSELTRMYTNEAVQYIRAHKDGPFFLMLSHNMPHVPIAASEAFAGTSAAGRYGDVIEEIDWSAGQLIGVLKEENLLENTLVIFTSDNGANVLTERFLVDDQIMPWDVGTGGALRGHKRQTYEGGMRVPALFYWPGTLPAGQLSGEISSQLDLLPTLLTLADLDADTTLPLDGKDIWPLLMDNAPSPHEYFYYHRKDQLQAIRSKTWKLRSCAGERYCPEETELFNLVQDPYEQFNVASDNPEVVERLKQEMLRQAAATGAWVSF